MNAFGKILEAEKGVEEWQIELRKKDNDPFEVDEVALYLSVSNGIDSEKIKEKISQKIRAATEVSPNEINVLPHNQMLEKVEMEVSHKAKRIVDKRPAH